MDKTQEQTQTSEKDDLKIQTNEESQYKIVDKVTSYPIVTTVMETAKGYYDAAKESSTIVKSVAETAESSLSSAVKSIQPVLENETYVKPLLTAMDNMAVSQLDKLEKTVESYQPAVENLKSKAVSLAENSVEKIAPIDAYLKDSYIAAPVNIAVQQTEKLVNRYIPEEGDKSSSDSGPIFRSGKIAMRLQHEALARISNLSIKNVEQTHTYAQVIDLIQYAVANLDRTIIAVNNGMEVTTQYANSVQESVKTGVEMSKEGAQMVMQSQKFQDAKTQVEQRYQDAMTGLAKAIEQLPKQAPTVTEASQKVYDMTMNFAQQLDLSNMALYSTIATKSSDKLKELSTSLQSAATSSQETIDNARSVLHGVLDNLIKVRHGEMTISEIVRVASGSATTSGSTPAASETAPTSN